MKTRITKTQRGLLQFLTDCGGRGQVYTGVRTFSCSVKREVAHCNAVSDHFMRSYGLMARTESNREGWWYRITPRGKLALERGWHDPSTREAAP